jgi:superoxide dismutase
MATAATAFIRLNLAPLPYPVDALEPVISGRTLSFHQDKHHRAYVETLNKLIVGTEFADLRLDQIATAAAGRSDRVSIFNNAAQAWNHGFYWNCLKPKGGGEPPLALKQKMEAAFGSVDACKKELVNSAVTQFGSGWAWLVLEGNQAQDHEDRKRERSARARPVAAAHNRRVGACLLPRLPEQARGSCQRSHRQAGELGVCG